MSVYATAIVGLGGLVVALFGALVRHMMTDADIRRALIDLKARVTKLDGINGHHG